ncbi:DNA gyrase subunit A [Candidatus Woesebacteria bacterium RIFCSPHIGHO2_01_FULL_39_28]|uniref:DNA gyrase subunit A n=1 Tax=Candidatus Woesebacteria bacterium RIFCSPHIGHO2_01_FULL_39_28 TaxID=1802496 RepID=A0A1F7YBI9_9BACT|nr:MAG: DNA gyrase subunit A [Candidatus Woesebacteria bacterium RIFCSPHIGHO2_01_FULL_39_28]OGM58401.1 MAG: DNA gyrase subunit A [Candidatus Woesebacteria bacterium RIFCSPLOWO2_01_FULL_38_20]
MDIGKVISSEITTELSRSYLDYAMSVIVARALPDIRDGLKPVHRRILYAMHQLGLGPGASYSKSAKIVGEVLGKYHPHGDQAVYDTLVRLAQEFSMRYPLIDGQGNFGSVDGDPPAAMRYTEVRLAPISSYMLTDIEKETVDFTDNFDATLKEPVYMPSLLPNLLLMGSEGIAVGMATKIPPHNIKEVIDALTATIKKGRVVFEKEIQEKEAEFFIKKINLVASGAEKKLENEDLTSTKTNFDSEITVGELTEILPGPDFPTGGVIYDSVSLIEMYATGRGKVIVRGVAEIKESEKSKSQIVISQIPYQVNKSELVAKIADLVKLKKIVGIGGLRDESDKDGIRVVIDIKRDGKPKAILNNLYKHTNLQTSFPANFVALIDGVPHTVNLKQILVEYVKHRQKVITRRTIFELTAAKKRAHILEGLKIALDNLDTVIKTIRQSATQEDAKNNLMTRFGLTVIQATAILDMQLRRLAALEREKIEKEYKETAELINRLTAILKNPQRVLEIITNELTELKTKFGDERKTKIYKQKIGVFSEEDLVPKEETLITVTKTGYIKRVPRNTYRAQRRGGKGVVGMTTKDEDEIDFLLAASTHDTILFFTNRGRVFRAKAWEIPETSRQSKGQALVNFINLESEERVQSILPMGVNNEKFLIMTTALGNVKKTSLDHFQNLRSNGIISIKLEAGDSLVSVKSTTGTDKILLLTLKGKSILFPEKNARPMGRGTTGVRGIRLESGDRVIGMEVFPEKEFIPEDKRKKVFRDILTISEKGLGKRTPVKLFPLQKRGGKGVKAAQINAKTGDLATAIMVNQGVDQIALNSKLGQVIKLPLKNIPQLGRATQGVILMRFTDKEDSIAAVATLDKNEEDE